VAVGTGFRITVIHHRGTPRTRRGRRRHLLDRLFQRDGQTLTELESELHMTRFGVMKHLRVLEEAGLVVTRRSGREKLHFLNAVPIRLIHDRWIDKYTERHVSALADLKTTLEEKSS
jgi:DNA-binding transcriptional ArsR family regulator